MNLPRSLREFYGWRLVACGFGIQFLISSLLMQAYGAYVPVLRDDLGWSKTALSGAYSMQQLEAGILGPVQGWLLNRLGPRTMMRAGIVVLGIGFILMSRAHSLPLFYASILVMSIGASLGGWFTLTVIIVNWFERYRARALSAMSIGFGLGGTAVPIIALSLEELGWRPTAFASGVLVLVVGLPLAQMVRARPEDHGEVVDGIRTEPLDTPAPARAEPQVPAEGFTIREAMRTPAFWLISLGHGSALLVVSAVSVHVISHLKEDLGYSVGAASLVITLMTVFQMLGMVVGGVLGDRFDKRLIAVAGMAMHTAGLLLVAYAVTLPMVIGFAVLHGTAWGMRGPLMQAIRADYFGRRDFGLIMGVSSLIIMFGQIAGPLIAGSLADATGSYESGFTLLAVLTGLGSAFFFFARRPALPARDRPGAPSRVEAQPAAGS